MKVMKWHWLYAGAFLFMGICVYIVYQITFTGDISIEWALVLLMALAMVSFISGWLMERDYKRKHPDEKVKGLEDLL